MKIKGTYIKDYIDMNIVPCVARIEKEMLYVDSKHEVKQPKERKIFVFKRTDSDPRLVFTEKFVIEYYDTDMIKRFVLIKPNLIQIVWIKLKKIKHLLEQYSFEFAMATVVAFTINIISSLVYENYIKEKSNLKTHIHPIETNVPITPPININGIKNNTPENSSMTNNKKSNNKSLVLSNIDSLKKDGSLSKTSDTVNLSNFDSLNRDTIRNK